MSTEEAICGSRARTCVVVFGEGVRGGGHTPLMNEGMSEWVVGYLECLGPGHIAPQHARRRQRKLLSVVVDGVVVVRCVNGGVLDTAGSVVVGPSYFTLYVCNCIPNPDNRNAHPHTDAPHNIPQGQGQPPVHPPDKRRERQDRREAGGDEGEEEEEGEAGGVAPAETVFGFGLKRVCVWV